jgi:hypothetical protein
MLRIKILAREEAHEASKPILEKVGKCSASCRTSGT